MRASSLVFLPGFMMMVMAVRLYVLNEMMNYVLTRLFLLVFFIVIMRFSSLSRE
jgi:hypothetical protein